MAETKLTAPNGGAVSVDSGRVENLLRYGFAEASETKAAKKSSSSKSNE